MEAEVTSYTIIIEDAGTNFCAYVADLLTC